MTDVSRQLTEAKQVIRSILITAPNGLTVRQLISDYKKLNGKELQFREFGYANPTYFLQSMPEVVKLEWSPSIQDFILKGIADESTKHIDSLVKRSKRSKKNTHNFPNSRSSRFDKNLKTSNARPTKRFVTADLKNKIQELLCCYKSGILLSNFELAFYKRFGINLDLKLLGFSDLEEFLKEMPDIVRMEENGKRVCSIDSMKKREEVFPKDTSMKTFNENERNHHNLLISNNKTYTTIEITPKKSNNEEKYNNQSLTNKLESSQNLSSIKNILFECPTSENNDIKEELRKVLSCHPDGIWATDFMKKYEEILKKELNLTEMGYSSLIELVSCFPDIFFIHQPELCKDNWLLLDVNNSAVKSLKEDTKKGMIIFYFYVVMTDFYVYVKDIQLNPRFKQNFMILLMHFLHWCEFYLICFFLTLINN
ncbi:tudor domain-containing protein 5-like [Centruroides sculpturatus]|uniref:tudor domain-containing protein 5-like n=1 Tax=Centruroides sculpturatus TaxID=218467 RepID=UPI000C6CADE1|nr:tudor domain-containing protein 5-like [Centruroides sculpturatus]